MVDHATPEQCVRFQASATSSHGCPITVDQMWSWFCDGYSYTYRNYFEFGAAEVKEFIFDARLCNCAAIMFNPIVYSATAGPILVDLYANPTFSADGTILVPVARRVDQVASSVIIRQEPTTISDNGTKLPLSSLVPSTGVTPTVGNGANSAIGNPFEINKSVPYLLMINNTDGASTYVCMDVTWFELPTGF